MSKCNPLDLPMVANTHVDKSFCPEIDTSSYKEGSFLRFVDFICRLLVGKLNHLSVVSRPDLSFTGFLCQVLKNPSQEHSIEAKKALRYLKVSSFLGLSFESSKELKFVGICDSDWGGNPKSAQIVAIVPKIRV